MRNGKVSLVTGSSSGIGRAVAIALAKAGYDVAVHYATSREKALEVVETIESIGVKACLVNGDMGDIAVPGRIVAETVAKLGRLDVLVNNAGFTVFEKIVDIRAETMDRLYHVNYRGMILCAQAAARHMLKEKIRGSILFNTSVRSYSPHSDDGIYGSLKAGINRVIESFAVDLARYGIRVNGFAPGIINVRVDPKKEKDHLFYKDSPRFIPLRRNGYAEDLGGPVVWLVSDDAAYVTGQVIKVDGGISVVGCPDCFDSLRDYFDMSDYLADAPTFDLDQVMNLDIK